MDRLSEAAQVELMKLAVEMAKQYQSFKSSTGTFDRAALRQAGIDPVDAREITITDLVDHFYAHLCEQIKP